MPSRGACLVLGAGLGALIQPLIAVGFALHYRRSLIDPTQRR